MIGTMKRGGDERQKPQDLRNVYADELFEDGKEQTIGNPLRALAERLCAAPPSRIAPSDEQLDAYDRGELSLDALPFYVDELPQVRSDYDTDGLLALARAIESTDQTPPYIELIHDLDVLEYDNREDLERYLDDHRRYHGYEIPISVDSLYQRPDGTWRILNCGHRRNRALRLVAEAHGYVLSEAEVPQQLHRNLPFYRAIARQGRENEHERVSPEDMANDIAKHYRFFEHRFARRPSYVELSRISGYTPDRISTALKFYQLPEEVKGFFRSGLINYQVAVDCYRLLDAARTYYVRKYPEQYGIMADEGPEKLETAAKDLVMARLNVFMTDTLRGVGAERKREMILAKIRELTESVTYLTDELFELVDGADRPDRLRARSSQQLGQYAVQVILTRLESDTTLSPAERVKYEELGKRLANLTQEAPVLQTATKEIEHSLLDVLTA